MAARTENVTIASGGLMSKGYKSFGFTCLFLLSFVAAASGQEAQPSPLPKLSRPTVMTRPVSPVPQPGMSAGANPDIVQPTLETAKPNLQAMLFPSEGVLIETSSGETVLSQSVDTGFNPASAVKLATALAALKTFGPEHRFDTALWTNGTFEKSTGTITGDLIISGRDPSFHYEHAIDIAKELNRLGIWTITGDLIVPPKFTMNFDC
jgi:D-alanyl-D-alanine carboxypeptidase/D-alanyl-D-alanine-endopeptidase (penicillin-binding protein 4)